FCSDDLLKQLLLIIPGVLVIPAPQIGGEDFFIHLTKLRNKSRTLLTTIKPIAEGRMRENFWVFNIFAPLKIVTMALSEQEILRREALAELRKLGINPYPAAEFNVTAHSTQILENFEEFEGKEVVLAGRMMSQRIMGKASFAELKEDRKSTR